MAQNSNAGQGIAPTSADGAPQVITIDQAVQQHSTMLNEMQAHMQNQQAVIARLSNQQASGTIRPPKPDTFDGRHCETFIYSLEKLFAYHGENSSERMVSLAVTFLRGSALRWYRCAERQDTKGQLRTWPSFTAALKTFFMAANTETVVRNKLANLRQMTSVAKYNDLFNALIIEVHDMDSKSKRDLYIRGLKSQVQLHVTLKEPLDIETAQRVALDVDGILMETGFARAEPRDNNRNKNNSHNKNGNRISRSFNSSSNSQSVPMDLGQMEHEYNQEEHEHDDDSTVASAQSNYKGNRKMNAEEQKRLMREGRCFGCGETGHLLRDCPNRNRQHSKND